MTYRIGQKVLVEAKVLEGGEHEPRYKVRIHSWSGWVKSSDIHGPAPLPEVDWESVEMGTRVMVRDSDRDDVEWFSAVFVRKSNDLFWVLLDGQDDPTLWRCCKLAEFVFENCHFVGNNS